MKLENIPRYLKENASWCLWKKEVRNGKETKIPINPRTGSDASVNKPDTFTSFEKAVEKLEGGIRVDPHRLNIHGPILVLVKSLPTFTRILFDLYQKGNPGTFMKMVFGFKILEI